MKIRLKYGGRGDRWPTRGQKKKGGPGETTGNVCGEQLDTKQDRELDSKGEAVRQTEEMKSSKTRVGRLGAGRKSQEQGRIFLLCYPG